MTTIGIDPGYGGAIAVLSGKNLVIFDMPIKKFINGKKKLDLRELSNLFTGFLSLVPTAVVEDVHSMPSQGVTSSFNFGYQLGILEGMLEAKGLEHIRVAPQVWKGYFGLLHQTKEASREAAIKLFSAQRTEFARVKDDGRAEAALMALWLQEKMEK